MTKTPNLDPEIWAKIDESIGKLTTPEEVLDYIYAVLHSPNYRDKYKEFLKIDFPRVPYPDALVPSTPNPSRGEDVNPSKEEIRKIFDDLVRLGGELRELHLLESPRVHDFITTFPIAGSGEVEKVVAQNSPLEGSPKLGVISQNSPLEGSPKLGVISQNSPLEGSPKAGVVALDAPSWAKGSLFPYWLLPKNKNLADRVKELRKQ